MLTLSSYHISFLIKQDCLHSRQSSRHYPLSALAPHLFLLFFCSFPWFLFYSQFSAFCCSHLFLHCPLFCPLWPFGLSCSILFLHLPQAPNPTSLASRTICKQLSKNVNWMQENVDKCRDIVLCSLISISTFSPTNQIQVLWKIDKEGVCLKKLLKTKDQLFVDVGSPSKSVFLQNVFDKWLRSWDRNSYIQVCMCVYMYQHLKEKLT